AGAEQAALLADEGRDGGEVIGLDGVAQAQDEAESEGGEQRGIHDGRHRTRARGRVVARRCLRVVVRTWPVVGRAGRRRRGAVRQTLADFDSLTPFKLRFQRFPSGSTPHVSRYRGSMRKSLTFIGLAIAVWGGSAAAQTPPGTDADRDRPPGFVGRSIGQPRPIDTSPDFVPIPDRWRLGLPNWNRYERPIEAPYVTGRWWDPYNQNVLKGDFPILGQNVFINLSAISDTLFEARRVPTPSNVSSAEPDSADVFGNGDQLLLNHNFIVSMELFKGDTAFKPRDWELRLTGVFNFNFLQTHENGVVNIDVREGVARDEDHASLQEFFFEYHLGDLTPTYDFLSTRAGIQGFTSDFRGFIFSDNNLGFRAFGNLGSNRDQFNVVYFRPLEKDTNSGLNRLFDTRGQHLGIVNYFRQDFLTPGYTLSLSAHYLHDSGGEHTDENGFVVRPAVVGTPAVHTIDAVYLGWTGDGH